MMEVDPVRLQKIIPAQVDRVAAAGLEPAAAVGTSPPAAIGPTDRLALSAQASEVQAAQEALAVAPEVRAERIAALKAQIAAGTYRVDAEKIAEKLIP